MENAGNARLAVVLGLSALSCLIAQTLNSVSPATGVAGTDAFTLSVTGQNFTGASNVTWTTPDGRKITVPTSFLNAAQLTASVPSTLMTTAGTAQVAVATGNSSSGSVPFTIWPFSISALAPVSVATGSPSANLNVFSNGFSSSATVVFTPPTGSPISITPGLVESAHLLASIPQALLTTAGTAQVAVVNANGVQSNSLPFQINTLSITNSSLPAGMSGALYKAVLAATGGAGPSYTWSVIQGALPSGLSLDPNNGVIFGSTSSPGVYSLTVQVVDANLRSATRVLSLVIGQQYVSSTVMGGASLTANVPATSIAVDAYQSPVALDSSGNPYFVSNSQILKVDSAGVLRIVAGTGRRGYSGDLGSALNAEIGDIVSLAFDGQGNLYFADTYSRRVRKISANGIISTVAGGQTLLGHGNPANALSLQLNLLRSIAADANANLYVATDSRVIQISPDGTAKLITGGGSSSSLPSDGMPAIQASVIAQGLAVDASGSVYIFTSTIVYKVGNDGILHIFAGNGATGYSGDGGPATAAQLRNLRAVLPLASGDVYIASEDSPLRIVTRAGLINTVPGSTTYAGAYIAAVDAYGQLYNSSINGLQKISPGAAPVLITGNGAYYSPPDGASATRTVLTQADRIDRYAMAPDGTAYATISTAGTSSQSVRRISPGGVLSTSLAAGVWTVDTIGNVYYFSNSKIYKVSPAGVTTQVAGNSAIDPLTGNHYLVGGDGGPALNAPVYAEQIAVDAFGNLYFTARSTHVVRKIDTNGIISTIAGNGQSGIATAGVGQPATSVPLGSPAGITVLNTGIVYFIDNNVVMWIDQNGNLASFGGPTGFAYYVSCDSAGNVYSYGGGYLAVYSPSGALVYSRTDGLFDPGPNLDNSPRAPGQLGNSSGIAVDQFGNIVVATAYEVRRLVPAASSALAIPSLSTAAATASSAYSALLKTSGGVGPYSWSVSGLPAGLTLDPVSGTISGTPLTPGVYDFTATVTDSGTITSTGTAAQISATNLRLTVAAPLAVSSIVLPVAVQTLTYPAQTLAAINGTAPYTWTIVSGTLPPGLGLSTGGSITGTPASSGVFNFRVQVTDSSTVPQTAVADLSILVETPLVLSAMPDAFTGVTYSNFPVSGGYSPYSCSITAGALPSGITLVPDTCQIKGSSTSTGRASFTLSVVDALGQTAAKNLTLSVVATLTLNPNGLTDVVAGTTYSLPYATGGTQPYGCQITSGSLAAGLTLNSSTCTISGTPLSPVDVSHAGSSFTISAADAGYPAQTASKDFAFVVENPLTIDPTTTGGVVGVAYKGKFGITAGMFSPVFTITGGSLPPGITMTSYGGLSGTPALKGTYTVTLQVKTAAQTASQSVTMTVYDPLSITSPASLPSAVQNQSYGPVLLTAAGGTGSYSGWSSANLPAGLTLSTLGQLTGTPTATGPAQFTVSLTNGTSPSQTATQAFTMNVEAPLNIQTVTLPFAITGAAYSNQISSNGGAAPFTWSITAGSLPTGLSLDAGTGLVKGAPSAKGTTTFTAKIADAAQAASQAIALTVYDPLSITTGATLPKGAQNQTYTTLILSATGGSGSYTWTSTNLPAGLSLSPAGQLNGTPSATGTTSNITFTATDTLTAQTATQTFTLTVETPLSISSATLPFGITGTVYSNTLASAGGLAPFAWSITSGTLPANVALNTSTGGLTGTPNVKGTYNFTVTLKDAVQTFSKPLSLTIYDPVSITTSSLPAGTQGAVYSPLTMAASGGGGTYSWTANNLPAGLSLSAAGLLSGTPAVAGNYTNIQITVTDSVTSLSSTSTYTLTIAYPPLSLNGPIGLPSIAAGAALSATYAATGGKPPYAYAISGMPTVVIDQSGHLSGTINAAGNTGFTVQVTDAQGRSAAVGVFLSVLGFTTASLPNGMVAAPYTQSLSAAGGAPPYTFSAVSALPNGLTLSPDGILTGTPKQSSSFSLALQVSDSNGLAARASIPLSITPAAALTITTSSLANGTLNVGYSDVLNASGGLPPYTWALTGGTLPAGLSLSTTGTVSGLPTAAGTFPLTFRVTDGAGAQTTAPVSLRVTAPALTLTTTSFPAAMNGSPYPAQSLGAAGGVSPYTYAVVTGSLPAGLALSNGQITGTPTTTGVASFSLRVTDSSSPALTVSAPFQIQVQPPGADLVLSSSSVAFNLVAGSSSVPVPANIVLASSTPSQVLNYNVAVNPQVQWLLVTGAGSTTPGSLRASLGSQSLSLAPGSYSTTIQVTCAPPSPCAGHQQSISVTLTITAPAPQLSVTDVLLSLASTPASSAPVAASFNVQNSGGGSLAVQSVTAADNWLTLTGVPSAVNAGSPAVVGLTANPAGLAPGYYRSSINIQSSAGNSSIAVGFLVASSGFMTLNPAAAQSTAISGGVASPASGSLFVTVSGTSTVNWNASVTAGAPWLVLGTTSGSSTSAVPGTVNYSLDRTAMQSLAAGTYYGTVRVTSSDVFNSPLDFPVILTVAAPADTVLPNPLPAGVVFISTGTILPPQNITVGAASASPMPYQASASTADGTPWLIVNPALGTTSAASPGQSTVSVNTAGLAPGTYRGTISYSLSSAAVQNVNVTLVIPVPLRSPSTFETNATVACSGNALVVTHTSLADNFTRHAGTPTPISAIVTDNCGNPVKNASVAASFSDGDTPVILNAQSTGSTTYWGLWTPQTVAAPVSVTISASAPSWSLTAVPVLGQITAGTLPLISNAGALHVFNPRTGAALSPGGIAQIYGTNFSSSAQAAATIPLPGSLAGTTVTIGGLTAPLFYVSPGQINAQVPFELAAGKTYQITVANAQGTSSAVSLPLIAAAPGIAAYASGALIAQHTDGSLVSAGSPAKSGEVVVLYLAGLGLTSDPVPSGTASPGNPLQSPQTPAVLLLNGKPVPTLFTGLTPGLVGLYQVNFQVPQGTPDGNLQVQLMQGREASNAGYIPVKSAQ